MSGCEIEKRERPEYIGDYLIPRKNESPKLKLNNAESLIGFLGWLSTRNQAITLGKEYDPSQVIELYCLFTEANNLDDVRDGYFERLVVPNETN